MLITIPWLSIVLPSQRPTAEEVVTSLEELKADIEGPDGDVASTDAVRQVMVMRAMTKRDMKKTDKLAERNVGIDQLQQELEHEQVHYSLTVWELSKW